MIDYRPGVVLDPFAGTGTTLCVADLHGRDAIGFDLDERNAELVEPRMVEVRRALAKLPSGGKQLTVTQEALVTATEMLKVAQDRIATLNRRLVRLANGSD